jgi:hypothetical protein
MAGPLPDDRSAITAKVQVLLDRIDASFERVRV